MRFNTPPNWPTTPPGWEPPDSGWRPDPSWGPPPAGHAFWVNDDGTPADGRYAHWNYGEPTNPGDYGQQYGQPSPAATVPKKKKHTVRNLIIIVIALFILIAACNAVTGGGDDTEPTTDETSAPAAEPPAEGEAPAEPAPAEPAPTEEAPAPPAITYLGQTDSDTAGNVGDTLDVDNVAVTVTPLAPVSTILGDITCMTATLVNNDDDPLSYSAFSFSLQNPSGAAINSTFVTEDGAVALPTGDLAPTGTATGQVCFDGTPAAGQNVVLYAPFADFTTDRGAWVQTF